MLRSLCLLALPALLAGGLLTGCGSSEESAASSLKEKQYELTVDDFLKAAESGDLASVKLFEEGGIEVDAVDSKGNSALIRAAATGRVDVIEWLLDRGADPRHTNSSGRTGLISAAHSGHTDVARLLLSRGGDVAAKDVEGWNAINLAAYNGHSDLVEFLAAKVGQEALDSALLVACFKGDTAVIDQLLNHGAYVNTRSPSNQTPLMIAAEGGHDDAVKLLLQNQANPFALDEDEQTAANLAEANGREDLRDLILDPTMNWGIRDSEAADSETEAARTLDALSGGNGEILGEAPENGRQPMMALDGAVLENDEGAQSLKMDSYREKPLPVMLKGVTSESAQVRILSSAQSEPVEVRAGETIPNTSLKITEVTPKFISSKQGKGEMVDVSRIMVEDTDSGARHMLVKDVAGRSSDTYAVLTMPGSSYRYVVKDGDVFRAITPKEGEQDYEVLDIRPTQVVIRNVVSEEVLTIHRDGIAMR